MGRVGNRAEVTYSVTLLSRLRRRRGIGRHLPTGLAMAPTASPLFRTAGGVFDAVAIAPERKSRSGVPPRRFP